MNHGQRSLSYMLETTFTREQVEVLLAEVLRDIESVWGWHYLSYSYSPPVFALCISVDFGDDCFIYEKNWQVKYKDQFVYYSYVGVTESITGFNKFCEMLREGNYRFYINKSGEFFLREVTEIEERPEEPIFKILLDLS